MSAIPGMRTGNPALTMAGNVFDDWAVADSRPTTMTVRGTAAKAIGLLMILGVCGAVAWNQAAAGTITYPMLIGLCVATFVIGIVTAFKPLWAAVTGPIYAAAQGVVLGAVSFALNDRYPGIVANAVSATVLTAAVIFFMYTSRLIRVTQGLTRMIIGATIAFALYALVVRLGLRFFGGSNFESIYDASPLSLGISAIAIGLASLNLLLDFDFIERQSNAGASKRLEWYGAFALMVTLVWLYIEILRLLAKLNRR